MSCRRTGLLLLGVLAVTAGLGCNTTPVQDGAILGGALGAGAGAIIGHQSGKQGEGALIGAAAGALTGALVGDQVGRAQGRETVAYSAAAPPPPAPRGHYETHVVTGPTGERYEQRVWVVDR